ncbi:unnamed protein product [Closterium sp. Naga37s-1]|nr:unnamed protein product [Closterium sp. Naga37s-1]
MTNAGLHAIPSHAFPALPLSAPPPFSPISPPHPLSLNQINDENFPENSPWTCPTANVFYSASIIWGLIGPKRMLCSLPQLSTHGSMTMINDENFPENSPWTCPTANVFYSASIIWGLIGPERMFGPSAFYNNLNWWFLGGALAPIPFWAAHKMWPHQVVSWLKPLLFPSPGGVLA